MNLKYTPLFETFTLPNGITLKNRIVMAPMTTYSSNEDYTTSEVELTYYSRRAKGVGMVVTGCAYVTANGRTFHGGFGIDSDEFIPSLRRLSSIIQKQGAKAVLQIFHGGRKASPKLVPDGKIVGPSAVPFEDGPVPHVLSENEIESIINDFGEATRRAIDAGFDGVEIHGANGFLIHQFFSPHSNRRNDRYGGNLEKRMTFPLAIIDEVSRVVKKHAKGPFIVGYRFSPEEPETPGITMADTLAFIDVLANQKLDYLHISLRDFWAPPRRGIKDTRSRSEIIQEKVGDRIPVIGVGSIKTADDALQALQTGIPLLALGRELIIEPEWVEKVTSGKEFAIETVLKKNDQVRLDIPAPLWQMFLNRPGWLPMNL